MVSIGRKKIGKGQPTYIIAEAGVNHNGKLSLAKKLVDAAKAAGADAVKFQTYKTEKLITKKAPKPEYQTKNIGKKKSQFQMLKELELSEKEFKQLKKYCDKKKISFFSTPYDNESADMLDKLGVPAYKFSSIEVVNHPFIEYVLKKKKPLILSVGMSTMKEIAEAVKVARKTGYIKNLILMQCQFNYPARFEDVNLRAMTTIMKRFKLLTGYSDHTPGIIAPVAAVALGAVVIEKHFTLSRKLPGPDHKASLEPDELKEMVEAIRNTEKLLGSAVKKPFGAEKKNIKVSRKSIVAAKDIKKGEMMTIEKLAYKRPGKGLFPTYANINKILGRKARKNIKKDSLIELRIVG
ncbi:N-acetylneuraminate synthase [candidate division KSB1 bacterium]